MYIEKKNHNQRQKASFIYAKLTKVPDINKYLILDFILLNQINKSVDYNIKIKIQ